MYRYCVSVHTVISIQLFNWLVALLYGRFVAHYCLARVNFIDDRGVNCICGQQTQHTQTHACMHMHVYSRHQCCSPHFEAVLLLFPFFFLFEVKLLAANSCNSLYPLIILLSFVPFRWICGHFQFQYNITVFRFGQTRISFGLSGALGLIACLYVCICMCITVFVLLTVFHIISFAV